MDWANHDTADGYRRAARGINERYRALCGAGVSR